MGRVKIIFAHAYDNGITLSAEGDHGRLSPKYGTGWGPAAVRLLSLICDCVRGTAHA